MLAHARALLASSKTGATACIDADLRDTSAILAQAAELLDFSQPVAVTVRSREQLERLPRGTAWL